jgi:hypothetical protein
MRQGDGGKRPQGGPAQKDETQTHQEEKEGRETGEQSGPSSVPAFRSFNVTSSKSKLENIYLRIVVLLFCAKRLLLMPSRGWRCCIPNRRKAGGGKRRMMVIRLF